MQTGLIGRDLWRGGWWPMGQHPEDGGLGRAADLCNVPGTSPTVRPALQLA